MADGGFLTAIAFARTSSFVFRVSLSISSTNSFTKHQHWRRTTRSYFYPCLINSLFHWFHCTLERNFSAIYGHCCQLLAIVRATLLYFFAQRHLLSAPCRSQKNDISMLLLVRHTVDMSSYGICFYGLWVSRRSHSQSLGYYVEGVINYATFLFQNQKVYFSESN